MLPVGHADVLTGFPKCEGAELAIRTLNPEILLMDELAPGDGPVLEFAASSGVAVMATAHGGSRAELFAKPELCSVIRKNFRYTAEIQGPGEPLRLLEVGEEP